MQVTQCCFCNRTLVADIEQITLEKKDKPGKNEAFIEISVFDAKTKPDGVDEIRITRLYCPHHRIVFVH